MAKQPSPTKGTPVGGSTAHVRMTQVTLRERTFPSRSARKALMPWHARGVIFGNAGGLGAAGPKALDFEGRKWERLFEGDYTKAKEIMTRLDAEQVPNRLALPPDLPTFHVVV